MLFLSEAAQSFPQSPKCSMVVEPSLLLLGLLCSKKKYISLSTPSISTSQPKSCWTSLYVSHILKFLLFLNTLSTLCYLFCGIFHFSLVYHYHLLTIFFSKWNLFENRMCLWFLFAHSLQLLTECLVFILLNSYSQRSYFWFGNHENPQECI